MVTSEGNKNQLCIAFQFLDITKVKENGTAIGFILGKLSTRFEHYN